MIAREMKVKPEIAERVTHNILSHHGQREWGSAVAPYSREAWILHLCDGLSARIDDCDRLDMTTVNKRSSSYEKEKGR
jgi:3'-5' exoribonuclease